MYIYQREIYELIMINSRAHYIARIMELYSITGCSDVKYDIQGYNRMRRNIGVYTNVRKTVTIRVECT